jgi:glutamate--cysteine ligase
MLPFAFEPGMGFERYVDYALDVPMYFVKRGDVYHDVAGASFRDLLEGRLAALPGERATISDWANHLSTIFPEVRLKRYLEMRGADVGPAERIVAQSALMVGIYYDAVALDGALELIRGWSAPARQRLRDEAPRLGFSAEIGGRSLRDVARDMLALARGGLARRARRDSQGRDETRHLDPLDAIVESGVEPARVWLQRFSEVWGRSVDPLFAEARI